MIILLLLFLLGISSFFFFIFLQKYRNLTYEITEISKELEERIKSNNFKKIFVFSDEKSIHHLSVSLNKLIEEQRLLSIKQQRINERNQKMLTNISHDLKTPLTVILGNSELLLEKNQDCLSPNIENKIKRINQQALNVQTTINSFFDISRLESEGWIFTFEWFDLSEFLRNELIRYHELMTGKNIQVEIDIPDDSLRIKTDKEALRRILGNVIYNALKYGMDGNYFECILKRKASEVIIEITDHGKGIVEENQKRIFERLYTLEDARDKHYQGSGLGLTITKHLVEELGGKINLYSQPFKKTTFSINLPISN